MRLGHEKGKVRKTDECISELLRMRTLVNGVGGDSHFSFGGIWEIRFFLQLSNHL